MVSVIFSPSMELSHDDEDEDGDDVGDGDGAFSIASGGLRAVWVTIVAVAAAAVLL